MQGDIGADDGLESLFFDCDTVDSNPDRSEDVGAVSGARRDQCDSGSLVGERDLGAGYHRAGGILDRPQDCSSINLRKSRRGSKEQPRQQYNQDGGVPSSKSIRAHWVLPLKIKSSFSMRLTRKDP